MELKHVPAFSLAFLLVALTAGTSSVVGLSEEAVEFRQVRSAMTAGKTLNGKTVEYLARNRITDPGVVISVENRLADTALQGGETYEVYGKEKFAPPSEIAPRTVEIMAFDKSAWGQGATGMVAYKIMDSSHPVRFAIVFSVPWSHVFHSNWYGLTIISDDQTLDSRFYSQIYHHKAWSQHISTTAFAYGNDREHIVIEDGSYIITASMTPGKRAIMRVRVMKKHDDK